MATPKYNLRKSSSNSEETKAALEQVIETSFLPSKQITMISIDSLEPYPKQGIFGMRNLESLAESIKEVGITTPVIVRLISVAPQKYQLISGHRRKEAALMVGLTQLPCIVETLDDNQADIYFTDNLYHREELLKSERAFALKIQHEALKRNAGRPTENNFRQFGGNYKVEQILAKMTGESARQIQRYIRLTELDSKLLEKVDIGEIPMTVGYHPAGLNKDKQNIVLESLDSGLLKNISIDDAQRIVNFVEEINSPEDIPLLLKMIAKKKTTRVKELTCKLTPSVVKRYFPGLLSAGEIENKIIILAEFYERYKDKVGDSSV